MLDSSKINHLSFPPRGTYNYYIYSNSGYNKFCLQRKLVRTTGYKQQIFKNEFSTSKDFDKTLTLKSTLVSTSPFQYFTFFFILLLLFYFSYLKNNFGKYILQITELIVNIKVSNRLHRDHSVLSEKADLQLNILFLSIASLFCVYSIHYLKIEILLINDFQLLIALFMAILFYVGFRFFVNRAIGFFMLKQNEFQEYFYQTVNYYKILGIILLPITVLFIYLPLNLKIYLFF